MVRMIFLRFQVNFPEMGTLSLQRRQQVWAPDESMVVQMKFVLFRSPIWAIYYLVGGFNPFEKYQSNWIIFPRDRGENKNIWNHHLVIYLRYDSPGRYSPKNERMSPEKCCDWKTIRFIFCEMAPFLGDICSLVGGFSPTHLKNMRTVKLDHFPKNRVENKKYVQPPPTLTIIGPSYRGVWICMTQGLGISKPLVTWDPMILRVVHFQGYIILNMFLVFSKIFPKNQAPRTGIREKTLVIWLGRHRFLCPKMSSLVQDVVVFLH